MYYSPLFGCSTMGAETGMKLLLKNQTADELYQQLAHLGVKPRLARLLQVAAVRRGEYPADAPGVSPRVLAEVRRRRPSRT